MSSSRSAGLQRDEADPDIYCNVMADTDDGGWWEYDGGYDENITLSADDRGAAVIDGLHRTHHHTTRRRLSRHPDHSR